jgi:hypothetical protein
MEARIYSIPIRYTVFGSVEVQADSLEEAVEEFFKNPEEYDVSEDIQYVGEYRIAEGKL